MRIIGLFVFLAVFNQIAIAQNKLDSLLFEYENQTGTDKIDLAFSISKYYDNIDLFKSIDYAREGLEFSNEFGSELDIQNANNRLGIIFYKIGDLEQSNNYFLKAIKISMKLDIPDLQIESKLMNNVANNYAELKQEALAIEYYKKSLLIKREMLDSGYFSLTLNNLALTYSAIGLYDSAYLMLKEAYTVDKVLNDSSSMAYTNASLGEVFLNEGIVDSAIYYLEKSLAFFNKVPESDYVLAFYYLKLGDAYNAINKKNESKRLYNFALQKSLELGVMSIQKDCYKGLYTIANAENDYKRALEYVTNYTAIQDSIFKVESAQKLSAIETSYQIRNKEQEISILNANAQVDELKFYGAAGIAFVVIILLGFMYYRYYFKVKSNYILQQKNNTIQLQNKEIVDSVEYAKGIQEAILPGVSTINSLFNSAYLCYRPSKIVSGDFYWVEKIDNTIVVVLADGTGHGVPGAFLSVMGASILRQIISADKICNPGDILSELNKKVKEVLGQTNLNNTLKDGMDVAVCMLNVETGDLSFSGAKRPVLIKKDGDVQLIKGERFSIGGDQTEEPIFKVHHFNLTKGDSFLLFTDGIIDQFGGDENKKFMSSRLTDLYHKAPEMKVFGVSFEESMQNWMGEKEQTDDMLLLAIEI